MDEADDELRLAVVRWRALTIEWRLGRAEAAGLLGVEADALGLDLTPRELRIDAEHRMRLLVEVRDLIGCLIADRREVPFWLRGDWELGADQSTPLSFMSCGVANVRALRGALIARERLG